MSDLGPKFSAFANGLFITESSRKSTISTLYLTNISSKQKRFA